MNKKFIWIIAGVLGALLLISLVSGITGNVIFQRTTNANECTKDDICEVENLEVEKKAYIGTLSDDSPPVLILRDWQGVEASIEMEDNILTIDSPDIITLDSQETLNKGDFFSEGRLFVGGDSFLESTGIIWADTHDNLFVDSYGKLNLHSFNGVMRFHTGTNGSTAWRAEIDQSGVITLNNYKDPTNPDPNNWAYLCVDGIGKLIRSDSPCV